MLPVDLVLVRHGQSEGNIAKRLSEKGDDSAFTEEFRNRHTSSFRLSELGRHQANLAGVWIQKEFPNGFDRYITSEYARAMQTAALLNLTDGCKWICDFYLTERDWGEIDNMPENERLEKFRESLKRRKVQPFFWRPPNGESFVDLCLRVDRVLETLHRECDNKRVIIVCHGEVMRAFQMRIERISVERFRELTFSEVKEERIYNCQIVHYTRRDSETRQLAPYMGWMRIVRPTENPVWISDWRRIERPHYSSQDLFRAAHVDEELL